MSRRSRRTRGKTTGRWRYLFGPGQYVLLPSTVVMAVGDKVSGFVRQDSNAYSHVLGSSTNTAIYLQMFPNNQNVEFRLATADGYVGLWNDPNFNGYLGREVGWTLYRTDAGYKLEVDTGDGVRDLGVIASSSAFSFNTVGRGSFEGFIWNFKVNNGAVWDIPLDDGPSANNFVRNKGTGGNGIKAGFEESRWTRD